MRVTITLGSGGCQHVTVKNAADQSLIGVWVRNDFLAGWQDFRESANTRFTFITRACQAITDALASGAIVVPLNITKIKNYLESVEL